MDNAKVFYEVMMTFDKLAGVLKTYDVIALCALSIYLLSSGARPVLAGA
jgi:hypothetical protein